MVMHANVHDPFDLFWSEFPHKKAKETARRAFAKAIKLVSLDEMLEALREQAAAWTDPKYIPHAATWLNGKRWEDETTAPVPTRSPSDTGWTPDDADPFAAWSS